MLQTRRGLRLTRREVQPKAGKELHMFTATADVLNAHTGPNPRYTISYNNDGSHVRPNDIRVHYSRLELRNRDSTTLFPGQSVRREEEAYLNECLHQGLPADE